MKSPQKQHEHNDPPRFPHLVEPIEKEMNDKFKDTTKDLILDITKKLVERHKYD